MVLLQGSQVSFRVEGNLGIPLEVRQRNRAASSVVYLNCVLLFSGDSSVGEVLIRIKGVKYLFEFQAGM